MQVRVFEPVDTAVVIELWNKCGLLRPWNDPLLDILRKQAIGAELFLVCESDAQIVGAVMGGYDGHRGWMNYLGVDPGYQQSGCGRAMVTALERRLIAVGCPKINLQVRTSNTSVIEFYERIGYSIEEITSMGKRLIADSVVS